MFKKVLTAVAAGMAMGAAPVVFAQDLPTAAPGTPIRFIIPAPAGAGIDVVTRAIIGKLQTALGRTVIVDNRPGTAGNRAAEAVATAAPDGLTYLIGVSTIASVNPHLYKKMRFDPTKDLVPVASLIEGGYILVANNKQPYNTVEELIEAGKKNPGTITYPSYGSGSTPHICMEELQNLTGAKFKHVPYSTNYTTDLIGGHVDMGLGLLINSVPQVQQGNLKGLAFSYTRMPTLPNVRALSEVIPGYQCVTFTGVWAPKGLPEPMLKRMNDEISKIVRSPEFIETATATGGSALALAPAEFEARIRADIDKWNKIVPPLKLQID